MYKTPVNRTTPCKAFVVLDLIRSTSQPCTSDFWMLRAGIEPRNTALNQPFREELRAGQDMNYEIR